jgi:hypothetical protein
MERREDTPHLDEGGEADAWPTPMFVEFSLSVVVPNMMVVRDGRMDGWMDGCAGGEVEAVERAAAEVKEGGNVGGFLHNHGRERRGVRGDDHFFIWRRRSKLSQRKKRERTLGVVSGWSTLHKNNSSACV